MNAKIKVYTGTEMTAQDFAMLIEKVTPTKSGILYGCGVTKKNSTNLHISSGWCIVRGRIVRIDEGDIPVQLPGSGSITRYLVLTVDLANGANPATVTVEASVGTDTTNFNVLSGQAYLSLAKLNISSGAIETITDMPVAISGASGDFARYTISTNTWSSGTTTVDGIAYYTYTIDLNRIMDQIPEVSLAANGTVPTPTEKKAYSKVQATIVNLSTKKLVLYAQSKPTSNFTINVKGVS